MLRTQRRNRNQLKIGNWAEEGKSELSELNGGKKKREELGKKSLKGAGDVVDKGRGRRRSSGWVCWV